MIAHVDPFPNQRCGWFSQAIIYNLPGCPAAGKKADKYEKW